MHVALATPDDSTQSTRPHAPVISARAGVRVLILVLLYSGYLNALLRTSAESQVTLFRLVFPVATMVMFIRFARRSITRRFVMFIAVMLVYMVTQVIVFGFGRDTYVLSYLINVVAAVIVVYFVRMFAIEYGTERLYRHLYWWYKVLLVLSIHQLLTGFHYPNAYFQAGYAQIFFGQQNDASLAIASFIPVLYTHGRLGWQRVFWLLTGLSVLYINNTRGVLVAVATYLLIQIALPFATAANRSIRIPKKVIIAVLAGAAIIGVVALKDTPIELADEVTTLEVIVITPLREIVTGEEMTEELTSINLRVTMAVIGIRRWFETYGFGVGPGATTYFVRAFYPGIAGSMHVFPLQLLAEVGWLFVGTLILIIRRYGTTMGWERFLPIFLFCIMVTASITSGAITNYFFFACATFLLTAYDSRPPVPSRRSPVARDG